MPSGKAVVWAGRSKRTHRVAASRLRPPAVPNLADFQYGSGMAVVTPRPNNDGSRGLRRGVPNFRSLLLYFPRMTEKEERLKQLAEIASNEQDLHKFIPLAREINLILEEKQERLGKLRIPSKPSE